MLRSAREKQNAHSCKSQQGGAGHVEVPVILVSAAGMFPGDLPGVIRVAPDPDIARDQFRVDGETFFASGYPRPMPGVPRERNLSGVSFAVANMTGFVVRALQSSPDATFDDLVLTLKLTV